MPKVSVIVPIYKAEQYVERCVKSILAQTFTDFELILVDDGSPDRSGEICDELARQDGRIRVIHQENCGASGARNRGLDNAKGDYIMFCDSDDVVSVRWVEHLYEAACSQENNIIFAMGSYCSAGETVGQEKALKEVKSYKIYQSKAYFEFNRSGIAGYICNSIFFRKIIEDKHLRFRTKREEGDYNEDLLFTLQYVRNVDSLVYVGFADYCYDTREGSLSRSLDQYYFKKYEEKYCLWWDFLQEMKPEDGTVKEDLARTMLYHFFVALNMAAEKNDKKKFREIVMSDAVARCAAEAKNSNESELLLGLLRGKHGRIMWIVYKIKKFKNKA